MVWLPCNNATIVNHTQNLDRRCWGTCITVIADDGVARQTSQRGAPLVRQTDAASDVNLSVRSGLLRNAAIRADEHLAALRPRSYMYGGTDSAHQMAMDPGRRPRECRGENTNSSASATTTKPRTTASWCLQFLLSRLRFWKKKPRTERFLTPVSPDRWRQRILFSTVYIRQLRIPDIYYFPQFI